MDVGGQVPRPLALRKRPDGARRLSGEVEQVPREEEEIEEVISQVTEETGEKEK